MRPFVAALLPIVIARIDAFGLPVNPRGCKLLPARPAAADAPRVQRLSRFVLLAQRNGPRLLPVIASAAKQSRAGRRRASDAGLLRCARNDAGGSVGDAETICLNAWATRSGRSSVCTAGAHSATGRRVSAFALRRRFFARVAPDRAGSRAAGPCLDDEAGISGRNRGQGIPLLAPPDVNPRGLCRPRGVWRCAYSAAMIRS